MAERVAANDTANLARVFEENTSRTIEAVDLTLLFLRDAYRHDPVGFTGGSWANGPAFLNDPHVQMALSNKDGTIVWSNVTPSPTNINIADRSHFQSQKTSAGDDLFISKPVLGRVSGKWSILLSRKLLSTDGSFAGIAVVSLDPHYLARFYQSIQIGHGSIILATEDGTILARVPDREALLGTEMPIALLDQLLSGTNGGSYRVVSRIDRVDRIYSSRRLLRYPLIVAVGLSAADVFAPVERNEVLYSAVGAILSIAGFAVGLILVRQRRSLLKSRHVLSVTLENMSQGITMIDATGEIQVLNQRATELLDLPAELVAARPTYRQIFEWQRVNQEFAEDAGPDAPLGWMLDTTGVPYGDYMYERTRRNGTVLEVRTLSLPDGGIVRTFTDITARKQNESALATARGRAAHAERMQVLGQLAGGIAHDFNNILQAVQGCADLIHKRTAEADDARRFARMILEATERGTSITGRLLAFARRGELQAEPIDAAGLLAGLHDVFEHALGSPAAIEMQLDDDLPPILADKGQLQTVLVNLVTNARDAMPHGGKLTIMGCGQVAEATMALTDGLLAGRYVRLSIGDTGSGMDEATVARALEPFFSTKPPGQGTGLGLSMAKDFLEQSGGALSIDSVLGQGTTVHLWLPATARAVAPTVRNSDAALRDKEHPSRILLVDDEATVRETLATSLEDTGYIVLVAADGPEALEILVSDALVDVLVTDGSGMDGTALIRQARCHRPDLPAVLLTGYAGHGALLAPGGGSSVMRKPVTAAQLADRIETLLAVPSSG